MTPWFTVRVDGWHGRLYSQLHSEAGASPGHSFTFTHCQHTLLSRVTRPVRLHLVLCVSRWWSAEEENGHSCIWAKNVSVTKCHNRWRSRWGREASFTYKVSKCQWGVRNKQYTLWRLYTRTHIHTRTPDSKQIWLLLTSRQGTDCKQFTGSPKNVTLKALFSSPISFPYFHML